jgi:hypothetical protein
VCLGLTSGCGPGVVGEVGEAVGNVGSSGMVDKVGMGGNRGIVGVPVVVFRPGVAMVDTMEGVVAVGILGGDVVRWSGGRLSDRMTAEAREAWIAVPVADGCQCGVDPAVVCRV